MLLFDWLNVIFLLQLIVNSQRLENVGYRKSYLEQISLKYSAENGLQPCYDSETGSKRYPSFGSGSWNISMKLFYISGF